MFSPSASDGTGSRTRTAARPMTPTVRPSNHSRRRSPRLGRRAVSDTFGSSAGREFEPDAVIANLYAPGARLGLHQDAEEPSPAPVVTISIGDTCLFRFAGVDRRTSPFIDLHLQSGDLLVFGGPSRRIYHGVPKVYDQHSATDPRASRRATEPHHSRNWIHCVASLRHSSAQLAAFLTSLAMVFALSSVSCSRAYEVGHRPPFSSSLAWTLNPSVE